MLSTILAFFAAIHSIHTMPDFFYTLNTKLGNSEDWYGTCKVGSKQSPINIHEASSFEDPENEVFFENYNKSISGIITRNSHTVSFRISERDNVTVRVNQNKSFKLHSIHFHWGCSEHLINNQSFWLEVHLVHYNERIGTFEQVKDTSIQGLAVASVIFEVKEQDNAAINVLLDMIWNNSTARGWDKRKISYRDLLPEKVKHVYQYSGSLTTPPCSETVLWNIVEQTNYLSQRQLYIFESLIRTVPRNCRRVQPLNLRKVFKLEANAGAGGTTTMVQYQNVRRLAIMIILINFVPVLSVKLH